MILLSREYGVVVRNVEGSHVIANTSGDVILSTARYYYMNAQIIVIK